MGALFAVEVTSIVASLKLYNTVPLSSFLLFPAGAAMALSFSTTIYYASALTAIKSGDLADQIKKSGKRYEKVVGASMRPLYVEARPFFVMEKTTAFAYSQEVIDKTISVLLLN